MSTFHSTKNSCLNFRKFSITNGTTFSETWGKEDKTREVYSNLRRFLMRNFCSTWLSFQNFWKFRLNGSCLRNSNISGFSGNIPRKLISILFVPVSKFSEFLVEWKAPSTLIITRPVPVPRYFPAVSQLWITWCGRSRTETRKNHDNNKKNLALCYLGPFTNLPYYCALLTVREFWSSENSAEIIAASIKCNYCLRSRAIRNSNGRNNAWRMRRCVTYRVKTKTIVFVWR